MPLNYAALPHLTIDGQDAPDAVMNDILQIAVEESLHLPSMFTIVFNNPAFPGHGDDQPKSLTQRTDKKTWEYETTFSIGKSIRIGFTNSKTEATGFDAQKKGWIIDGEITGIETHFTSGSQATMVIRGYDKSHRLHRGRYNRSFQKMTDSDIVKKVIGEAGITSGTIDTTSIAHDYVFQENQTNMEFLRERAARNGFELFIKDNKLYFRKPKQDQQIQLEWLKQLTSFRVRVTSAEQVSSVEVRGWDYKKKQEIVATQSNATLLTKTDQGEGKAKSSAFQSQPKLVMVDQPTYNQNEAQSMAQALFHELADEFVHADAQAQGNTDIRPGCVVKLSGMGKYSGNYYVTETHHTFIERTYMTGFSVRGLRGGDLLSVLSPTARPKPGQTLLIGVVTNNQDPEKLGRVRVKFPTLTNEHESNWARVVAIGAGKNRGFDCLPEINDEVLVGFEHGDIHRPFVIGGLWNGQDAPPEPVTESVTSTGVRLRTIKTRTGHKIQFVEEDKGTSKKGIYLTSVYGHKVNLNDTDKKIEILTNGGHTVTLDDTGQKIQIKSTGGHTVELNDMTRSVSLDSKGSVSIKAATTLDIQATGTVTVKGAIIKLN